MTNTYPGSPLLSSGTSPIVALLLTVDVGVLAVLVNPVEPLLLVIGGILCLVDGVIRLPASLPAP